MVGYSAYKASGHSEHQPANWTRIDLLLALYDGAILRLERAVVALEQRKPDEARTLLNRVQLIVTEMTAGVVVREDDPVSMNLLRLYEYVMWSVSKLHVAQLQAGLQVLVTLRDAFRSVRADAIRLEQTGEVPSLEANQLLVVG